MKRRLLSLFSFCLAIGLFAQDPMLYRQIDGSQNNLANPDWGAAHTPLLQFAGVGFADGFAAPAGPERPNARRVSNIIFDQPELLPDPMTLSDYTWVFGQFMDHDIGLTEGGGEPMHIAVPQGDPDFDPLGFGNVIIPMTRTIPIAGTGTGVDNPRQFNNDLTAFIDGSGVYGSDQARADWLRSFVDGKMKVSTGNLLPYNTIDGEFESDLDPNAPFMGDDVGFNTRLFVAGDVRANENPLLLSLHTLFVREHNRRADIIKSEHPDWTDEQIYQLARKYVSGHIQAITYNEWLPAMGVNLTDYTGYVDTVHPQLTNTFTAAAFRVGHTLLNSLIFRVDPLGNELPQGHLPLRFGFFNVGAIAEVGGLDPYLAGMGQQIQQTMDSRVVSDVRNFLFGPPGAGGLDLAAINIQRGRDRGLPTFNAIRQAYGLEPYIFMEQINTDLYVYGQLFQAYFGDVNALDPWVGMLAETRMDDALFGETIRTIMGVQFQALRDGDRFFYLNDPVLTDAQKAEIHNTTFRDIIMHNSGITLMQDNVFLAMAYDSICGSATSSVEGNILVHTTGEALSDVEVDYLVNGEMQDNLTTGLAGQFLFTDIPVCEGGTLSPSRTNDQWINGITVQDIILVSRHILSIEEITNPYQLLAADANNDGTVNVNDIIAQRRLILDLDQQLVGDLPMWVFVPTDYEFSDPSAPWGENIPYSITLPTPAMMLENQGFIAYKRGDVNASANLDASLNNDLPILARTNTTGLQLVADDRYVERGETVQVSFELVSEAIQSANYQFALTTTSGADFINVAPMAETPDYLNLDQRGQLRFCGEIAEATQQFTVSLVADRAGYLSDLIDFDQDVLPNLVISNAANQDIAQVDLDWRSSKADGIAVAAFPNPFTDQLTFSVPAQGIDGVATISLFNLSGQQLLQAKRELVSGQAEQWTLNTGNLPAGQYIYRLVTSSKEYSGQLTAIGR